MPVIVLSIPVKRKIIRFVNFFHDLIEFYLYLSLLQIPRVEALSLLGSLISLTEACKKMKVLDPQSLEPVLIDNTNTKV